VAYRSLSVTLTADTAPYTAALKEAGVETRAFGTTAAAAGKEAQVGYDVAAKGAGSYAAAVTEAAAAETRAAAAAEANVAKKVAANAALQAQAQAYKAISDAAVAGSEKQVAADRLLEVANKKLVASNLEVVESSSLMAGAGEKLGNIFEQIGLRVERSHGLVGAAIKGMTTDASTMATGVGAAVGIVGAAFGVLAIEGVKHFEELTGEIRQFQRIAGTSAEDSSKLVYAFKELGIAPEIAAKSLGIFSKNLVDHAAKVESYGVTIAHLKNGNVDTIGSLFNLADAFQKVGPGAEGTALALDLLGRGGAALIPVLQRGRDGLREFFAEAQGHGLVFSQKDLDDARNLTLATRNLHEAFTGFEVSLARDVIPQLTGLAHGLAAVTDAISSLHIPVVPMLELGTAAFAASKGVAALGTGLAAVGAEAAGAAVGGMAAATGGAVLLAGGLLLVAKQADKHSDALKKVDETVIGWERHIPLVGGALAGLDAKMTGSTKSTADHAKVTQEDYLAMQLAKEELAAYGDVVDPTATKISDLSKAEQQLLQESKKHGDSMAATAALVGISADSLASALGYQGKVGVDAFKAEEEAAKDFATAVTQAQDSASKAFTKNFDIVSNFSASSIAADDKKAASSAKAANSVVADDTRVADAIQHVADLQQQYSDKAASDRQAYADKVASADEAMTNADAAYADTVASTNQKVADADQKLADDRISLAQSVADAEQRLNDDRVSGQQSVKDAQQRLADTQARQAVQNNPAASKALNDQIALRDARAAVTRAQEAAAKKEETDQDAITKAKQNQIKTIAKDQEAADKARVDQVKQVEKAEDAVTKARQAQAKLAAEANTVGVETIQQQREMQKAVEAVTKAQQTQATAVTTSAASVAAAVDLSVGDVKKFYDNAVADADTFQANIQKAVKMGYNPQTISELLKEGSKEAKPLLDLMVSQTDNSFRDMVNGAETKMKAYDFQIRELARLSTVAAKSSTDDMNRDLSTAMLIMEANAADGGKKTSEAIAKELGIGRDEVARIANEMGIKLADGINPVLEGVGSDKIVIHASDSSSGNPTGKFLMATGGHVPGHGHGDIVPAMLTPGEFVISKPAVDRLGVDNLDKMHKTARRGYAEGGFVTAADVPPVPDFSKYGTAFGYSATQVDEYARAKVIAYLNAHQAKKGSAGPGGSGYGFQALIDYLNGKGVPNEVTSTTGGTHASGSRHAMGLAADFVSDNMDQIGQAFLDISGSMYELIHNPGFSIKGGQTVDPGFWGSDTWDQHTNHVHAATYRDAGEGPGIPTGTGALSGLGGSFEDTLAAIARDKHLSPREVEDLRIIGMGESGGQNIPQGIDDINSQNGDPAFGPFQIIRSTFEANKDPGHDDWHNPEDSGDAAVNYARGRYGSLDNVPGVIAVNAGRPYQGYADGGLVYNAGIMDSGNMVPPGPFIGMNTTGGWENLRPVNSYNPVGAGAPSFDYDKIAAAMIAAVTARPLTATVSANDVSVGLHAVQRGRR